MGPFPKTPACILLCMKTSTLTEAQYNSGVCACKELDCSITASQAADPLPCLLMEPEKLHIHCHASAHDLSKEGQRKANKQ